MEEVKSQEEIKELKCPKCGSKSYGRIHQSRSHYLVYCPNCLIGYQEIDID